MNNFYTEFDIRTRLSLAVELIDEFAPHLKPRGEFTITLANGKHDKIIHNPNRSGYYIFRDIANGSYELKIHGKYYLEETLDIQLPLADPLSPVVKVILKPDPLYTFPDDTLLIKGKVVDGDGKPVSGAKIKVDGRDENTETTAEGKFVIYFKEIDVAAVDLVVSKNGSPKNVSVNLCQERKIINYDGNEKKANVDSDWNSDEIPNETTEYKIGNHLAKARSGGTSSTIKLATTASDVNDAYKNMQIRIVNGKGVHQERLITTFDGSSKVATVDTEWGVGEIPNSTSEYEIVTKHEDRAQTGAQSSITLADTASGNDGAYNGLDIQLTSRKVTVVEIVFS